MAGSVRAESRDFRERAVTKTDLLTTVLEWAGALAPPAFFGALIGLRYAKEQTLQQRGVNFLISAGLGIVAGGVSGEVWRFGPWVVSAIVILAAVVGMDVMAGIRAIAGQFGTDPFGTFRAWWSTWWKRDAS